MTNSAQLASDFALVDICGLHKRFGDNEVLKGIDLQIKRQEVVCIIGKSGSGKSTPLRCINGLESFQQGNCAWTVNRSNTTMKPPCVNCARTSV